MNEYIKKRIIAEKTLAPVISKNPSTVKSGIYLWKRTDEYGITWFYVGQAVNIYERQIGHINGYQHIDLSLRKRKFKSEDNPNGWEFEILEHCNADELNDKENAYIVEYLRKG